jgi:hypothetical protein
VKLLCRVHGVSFVIIERIGELFIIAAHLKRASIIFLS